MLEDNLGRRFYYLRLSVTDVCNFRCNYCLPEGYTAADDSPHLTAAETATVIRAFASLGTQKVRLTGGEPSLRADLPEIIAAAKGTPGIRRVAVTSNGYKLPKVIDCWRRAGLDQLNISIDSLQPDEFARITGHDCLPKVLDGIDRALARWHLRLLRPDIEAVEQAMARETEAAREVFAAGIATAGATAFGSRQR